MIEILEIVIGVVCFDIKHYLSSATYSREYKIFIGQCEGLFCDDGITTRLTIAGIINTAAQAAQGDVKFL